MYACVTGATQCSSLQMEAGCSGSKLNGSICWPLAELLAQRRVLAGFFCLFVFCFLFLQEGALFRHYTDYSIAVASKKYTKLHLSANLLSSLFVFTVPRKHRGGGSERHRSCEGCCEEAEGKASPHTKLWPQEGQQQQDLGLRGGEEGRRGGGGAIDKCASLPHQLPPRCPVRACSL